MKFHVLQFKKKYKKTFVEQGRICATVKREHAKLADVIKVLLAGNMVKQKVSSIAVVP